MITHEKIVKKLGFDPLRGRYDYEVSDHENDSKPSPFSILNYEEKQFITKELCEAAKRGELPPDSF